jgi:hypothetical protein
VVGRTKQLVLMYSMTASLLGCPVKTPGNTAGTDGGRVVDLERGAIRLDPAQFDAGWVDDGGLSLGCEVEHGATTRAADCAPSLSGCQQAGDCTSGICLKLAQGGTCTRSCKNDMECDSNWACQSRWTGEGKQGFCVPAWRTP